MKVTLAYRYQGRKPGQTIDVDDDTGRMLIRSGRARPADPTPTGSQRRPHPSSAARSSGTTGGGDSKS